MCKIFQAGSCDSSKISRSTPIGARASPNRQVLPRDADEIRQSPTAPIHKVTAGAVVAIDGKTARASLDRAKGQNPLHVVSAWASANRVVLGEVMTEEKSNEITAIPKLLQALPNDPRKAQELYSRFRDRLERGEQRANRLVLSRLDAFAHDLYAVLTTGAHLGDPAAVLPMKPAMAAKPVKGAA